jgi:toxin CptA
MASFAHSAPPVVYPLGRSRFEVALVALTWLAGALLVFVWALRGSAPDWRIALGIVAVATAGLGAWAGLRKPAAGRLAWDGQHWRREDLPGLEVLPELELEVAADFQRALLLRLESPQRGVLWCWVQRSFMPERWGDLRRAVHAPAAPVLPAVAVSAHSDSAAAP